MQTKPTSIFFMILCSFFNALAFILLKKASENLSFPEIMFNYWGYLGVLTLLIGAIFMVLAFKGGNVSVLYPIMATTYIWMTFLSIAIFKEQVSLFNWIGIGLIVVGVSIVGTSSPINLRKNKNAN